MNNGFIQIFNVRLLRKTYKVHFLHSETSHRNTRAYSRTNKQKIVKEVKVVQMNKGKTLRLNCLNFCENQAEKKVFKFSFFLYSWLAMTSSMTLIHRATARGCKVKAPSLRNNFENLRFLDEQRFYSEFHSKIADEKL